MAETDREGSGKPHGRAARAARLAAALKANLRRRKAQARSRAAPAEPEEAPAGTDTAEPAPDRKAR